METSKFFGRVEHFFTYRRLFQKLEIRVYTIGVNPKARKIIGKKDIIENYVDTAPNGHVYFGI